ncbi:MAG: hypothetical protein AAF702_21170 [Chloroflexota bacterium]
MADTDNPLKLLVRFCIRDFAEWLLDSEVRHAHTLNIELTAEPTFVDQLFHVTLMDGRSTMLHIEFQGRSSRSPMRWRMLEYMSRLANNERDLDLCSVVFYVGEGVGAKDTGEHSVRGPGNKVSLSWSYQVVRLWEIPAQDLLALNRPGLLPLLGLTKLDKPEDVVPQVVDNLKAISDDELQRRLFASLMALLEDDEVTNMIDALVELDELGIDSAYVRRARKKTAREVLCRNILTAIKWRFDPTVSIYEELEKQLSDIDSLEVLDDIFEKLFQIESVDELVAIFELEEINELAEESSSEDDTAGEDNI